MSGFDLDFVGSAPLLSGAEADVDAVTVAPTRLEAGTLDRYLNAHPETRHVFQRHLARDLAGKVHRTVRRNT